MRALATSAAISRPATSSTTLFFAVLRVDPRRRPIPDATGSSSARAIAPRRSIRRSPCAAFSRPSDLATFMQPLSALNGHPNRRKVAGRRGEHRSARPRPADRRRQRDRVKPVRLELAHLRGLGDGELQEGSNWEAAMCAGHRELDTLTADRRPQPPAAGRAHRGDQPPRAACRQMARVRLGHGRMRRPRPFGPARIFTAPRAKASRAA